LAPSSRQTVWPDTAVQISAGMTTLADALSLRGIIRRLVPGRPIDGVAAVLLPFRANDQPDLDTFAMLVERTYAEGLTPAVNVETGWVHLLSPDQRRDVLTVAAGVARGRRLMAGAFIDGEPGDIVRLYQREIERIVRQGGTPILFQCAGLTRLDEEAIAAVYREATAACPAAIACERGRTMVPPGRIYSLDLVQRLMDIPQIAGLRHGSLDRIQEWYRLEARDLRRPEFRIYTGNDLAIDLCWYGSDYMLAVAACAPEAFALRDALWQAGDLRAVPLNDVLQSLGCLVCRRPFAACAHSIAQFLQVRGVLPAARPHPDAVRRPDSDLGPLTDVSERLEAMLHAYGDAVSA
jgi:dihydrodipicolinate synthase/N-acetylneuraminate lyase